MDDLIKQILAEKKLNSHTLQMIIKSHKKSEVLAYLRDHQLKISPLLHSLLKTKPVRSLSGITPVTVLTKPFPCPGTCIFCPLDARFPKSYLPSEPGAQRAFQNSFDPYLQTYNRLLAYQAMGHSIEKIEIIVLGGTWSFYEKNYQHWFIKRIFEALNDFGERKKPRKSQEKPTTLTQLKKEHERNESASSRCVGLVLETRPDFLTQKEIIHLRTLGATKIQVGIQSLQDKVLKLNRRGHTAKTTQKAIQNLRLAGFKIHGHWMPNLYGSNPEKDIQDYQKLFNQKPYLPDELKIYPCSLIKGTQLMDYYQKGLWQAYTKDELLKVLVYCLSHTPQYCRLTRVIRDIPGTDIVVGNKTTNFRQIAENEIKNRGLVLNDIHSREIRNTSVRLSDLKLKTIKYPTSSSTEYFLQYVNDSNQIAGFLRLSLPLIKPYIKEIKNSALIREVHVYGLSISLGSKKTGIAQHLGLGTKLIEKAIEIAKKKHFKDLAVISAIGTKAYYRKLGFNDGNLYQHYSTSNFSN